jgi:hypothetical protein
MGASTCKKRTGSSKLNQPQPHGEKTPKLYRPSGSFPFPPVRGKTLADVYVTMDSDMNCVTLCFSDKTALVIDIEPCLSFRADYSDFKTGNERIIKRWPRIRNRS